MSAADIYVCAVRAGFNYQDAVVATAITMPEAGANPLAIQKGQPYSLTGWGLWQITPGNSVPSVGVDNQLLDPFVNAKAAFAKFQGAHNTFRPWTTWRNSAFLIWLPWAQAGADSVGGAQGIAKAIADLFSPAAYTSPYPDPVAGAEYESWWGALTGAFNNDIPNLVDDISRIWGT